MSLIQTRLQSLATFIGILLLSASPVSTGMAIAAFVPSDSATQSIDTAVSQTERRNSSLCPESLSSTIDAIIQGSAFSTSRWGILVEPLSASEPLYSYQEDDFLIPASNVKLLTTAAALKTLDTRQPYNSASIRERVRFINLTSDNQSADALLRYLGGPHVIKDILTPLGINPNSYRQVDGSGLSRYNMATASTFVAILKAMHRDEEGNIFYASLPIAGMSGTLRYRFQNTSVQGQLRAKTGTLRGVRALSGFLEHPDYDVLVFSIMVNQPNQSGQVLLGAIDQIVVRLSQLRSCD
ncbi:MAG TPA: D-alanyl-D-alanine carboxypeptidase [Elainellaceae cyanobacterium]|jgi:D-alanyl-D-alanine carboxypeptidase/D-alanyl-D-alanine-endopeptidase (penicillin-binding protein 4)